MRVQEIISLDGGDRQSRLSHYVARHSEWRFLAPSCTTGMPLSACLAQQRPGIREVRISYGGGRYYNIQVGGLGSLSRSAQCASWALMLTCLLARPGTPRPAGSSVSGTGA